MDKAGNNIAEDDRVIILPSLVARQRRIRAARRTELVIASIGDPGGEGEGESLNGNDIRGID